MLGQEIIIYPCLLDHYNNPAEVTQFRIIGEKNKNYSVHGSEYRTISCNNAIEGIRIVGNKTIAGIPLNYSMHFTSHIYIYHCKRSYYHKFDSRVITMSPRISVSEQITKMCVMYLDKHVSYRHCHVM